jgi:hypothetical protein
MINNVTNAKKGVATFSELSVSGHGATCVCWLLGVPHPSSAGSWIGRKGSQKQPGLFDRRICATTHSIVCHIPHASLAKYADVSHTCGIRYVTIA